MPFARVGELELNYDVRGEGTPLLLITGLGAQKVLWPEGLCDALAQRGFEVARFDNRDIGRSTRLNDLGVPSMRKSIARWVLGRRVEAPYQLEDMACDGFGLLDELGWKSAHVVGASMGGMIAQCMAIGQPTRVRSLTSIMSHPGDRLSKIPTPQGLAALTGPRPRTREEAGQAWIKTFSVIGSKAPHFEPDLEAIRALGELSFDRGVSPQGFVRQFVAVVASGDRRPALRRLDMPALVVHGTADPLVRFRGGKRTAQALRRGTLLPIQGMGHDLPRAAWPQICDAIGAVARTADG